MSDGATPARTRLGGLEVLARQQRRPTAWAEKSGRGRPPFIPCLSVLTAGTYATRRARPPSSAVALFEMGSRREERKGGCPFLVCSRSEQSTR